MADNPFDRYDAPSGNPFDRFDEGASKPKPSKPFGQQMNETISDIPRQLGLTARHGIEGVGSAVDFLSSPFRAIQNAVLPDKYAAKPGLAGNLADAMGLPKPQNSTERVVGDVTQMMASGAVPLGLASRVGQTATGTTKAVGQMMAANPGMQMLSAGSSGAAGGYTRETGGNDTSQMLASLAAGVAAPLAANKAMQVGRSAQNMISGRSQLTPQQIDIQINQALSQNGMTMDALPFNIQAGMRADVQKALSTSGTLSPDAVRRLADYRLTGAMPNQAGLTRDAAIYSQQKNLAKLGINSKDEAAQQLGQMENANNRQFINGLNDLGANTVDDAFAGGQKIIGALDARNTRAKELIKARYDAARSSDGRSAPLDPRAFTNRAGDLLKEKNIESFLTPDIRSELNKFATGSVPLNVDIAEQFKTNIGNIQRNATEGNTRTALGLVRQALDEAPLLNGGTPGAEMGQQAINAFNKARRSNAAWMRTVENTPSLQAVRDGVAPDKFVQDFIVGNGTNANTMDLAMLRKAVKTQPEAMDAIKGQITSYLKTKALSGAEDEVGKFSQSAYNKALKGIGERKLGFFFEPDEINQMKAIGRVSSYEQVQPVGSAVNNSNTAAAGGAMWLDRIANSPLLSKIPIGPQLQQPMQNISVGIKSARALDVPRSIAGAPMLPGPRVPAGLLMSPAMFMQDDDEQRMNGLLSPRR